MDDERIIELVDEEGSKERFIFLTQIDHGGRQFAVLTPEEAEEDSEEEPIVILELVATEDSDEMELVSVDDDALAETVFNEYLETVDDEIEEDELDGDGEEE